MSDIIESLAGGVLIGLAATLLLFAHGRIAGISGIVTGRGAGQRASARSASGSSRACWASGSCSAWRAPRR